MRYLKNLKKRLFPLSNSCSSNNAIKKEQVNTTDTFFVNKDGSLSLNHNSEVFKKAFADNVSKLKAAKAAKGVNE